MSTTGEYLIVSILSLALLALYSCHYDNQILFRKGTVNFCLHLL